MNHKESLDALNYPLHEIQISLGDILSKAGNQKLRVAIHLPGQVFEGVVVANYGVTLVLEYAKDKVIFIAWRQALGVEILGPAEPA